MKEFTNLYPVSKTLRFELKPIGKTLDYIERNGFLRNDEHRAESYKKVKKIIDRYHKYYIDSVLDNLRLNDDALETYYNLYSCVNKTEKMVKDFENIQDNLRKAISSALKKDDRYKRIDKKELIREDLINFLENEKEKRLVEEFHDFTIYFTGFHENRQNMYSSEAKSTAIAYRLIHDNLPKMLEAVSAQEDYQPVIAGAPSITPDYYADYLKKGVHIVYGQTYELLSHSTAALVTSGTATLETALFKVPQVVCYDMPLSWLMAILRKLILKVKYISLVNLIADKDVVKELVVNDMKVANIKKELASILPGGDRRQTMLNDYQQIIQILGAPGASERAAEKIIECLKDR